MARVPDQGFWAEQLELTKRQVENHEKYVDQSIAHLEGLLKALLCTVDASASGALDTDKFQHLERMILMDYQRLGTLHLIGEEQCKLIRYLTPLALPAAPAPLAGKHCS